ncbi:MAG TPA: response regulator transcription factor, partial [Methylibium sp.]|nr:response regulator transcription factor [Methylibium sp.]
MKVLLIDDHPLILSALKAVIQGFGDDLEVVGVGSAAAARATLQTDAEFDLVLLDLMLGDANGFDLLGELRNTYPALPVVVVSASDRSSDVIRSIDMGAMGFVPKRASNETLFEALRLVMSGGIYVPPMTLGIDSGAPPGPAPAEVDTTPSYLRMVGQEAAQEGFQT